MRNERGMMNDEWWMMNDERWTMSQIDKIKRFIIDPIQWIVWALFSADGILIKQSLKKPEVKPAKAPYH